MDSFVQEIWDEFPPCIQQVIVRKAERNQILTARQARKLFAKHEKHTSLTDCISTPI